ncbi:MAG: tryptophan synthase subunit alpha, partial [Eubacterium sp.]|nr:tryptophan synthase subunit alpha [Eubacterium sp.]
MNKISDAFKSGKAFVGFVTAGDPDLETSEQIMVKMAQAGCDLIEIGIPFSDPIAEGPVIQNANIRALAQGTTTDKVFALAQ